VSSVGQHALKRQQQQQQRAQRLAAHAGSATEAWRALAAAPPPQLAAAAAAEGEHAQEQQLPQLGGGVYEHGALDLAGLLQMALQHPGIDLSAMLDPAATLQQAAAIAAASPAIAAAAAAQGGMPDADLAADAGSFDHAAVAGHRHVNPSEMQREAEAWVQQHIEQQQQVQPLSGLGPAAALLPGMVGLPPVSQGRWQLLAAWQVVVNLNHASMG
jgi:hypothetical protein